MAGRIEFRIDGAKRDIAFFAKNAQGQRAREIRKAVPVEEVAAVLQKMIADLEEKLGPF